MLLVPALALGLAPQDTASLADFAARPTAGPAPLRVAFEDRSRGGVRQWSWDFGDGSSSAARSPSHVYATPGRYTVTLTVSGPWGSASERKEDFVVARPALPGHVEQPNIVLIVLDDLGVDRLGLYHESPRGYPPPCTPSIDALAAEGVVFLHAYADPLCSSSRAQILTGRHGFRTGIGSLVRPQGSRYGLSARYETTLPEMLIDHDSSLLGKWHLAEPRIDGLQHPLASGFRYFAGTMFNPSAPPVDFGRGALDCSVDGRTGYFAWVKTGPGSTPGVLEQTCSTAYLTTDTADEAIARARAMTWPWFLQVSFNAVHLPTHRPPLYLQPPPSLCPAVNVRQDGDQALAMADSVVEALDTELGRTIEGIRAVDPEAYIFLISDNGTDPKIARGGPGSCFGRDRSKGTLYEGGIRVPLIAAGPRVVPGTCDALVSAVDLYATFAELAGVPSDAEDSVSLVPYLRGHMDPRRRTVYSEFFAPNAITPDAADMPDFAPRRHLRAIRNERYKLFRYTDEGGAEDERLYDLLEDPCEKTDLCPDIGPCDPTKLEPEQAFNCLMLQAELAAMGVY